MLMIFFFQAEDGIRDRNVTGVQTCALPIYSIRHLWAREHYARAEQRISARPQLARPTRCRNEAESVGSQARRCRGRQETLFAKLHGMSWSGRLWPGEKACCRFAASGRAESK